MEKLKRLILRPAKNKLVKNRSAVHDAAVALEIAQTQAAACDREGEEFTAPSAGAEKSPTGRGGTDGGSSAAEEGGYQAARGPGAVSQIPTGPACWRVNAGSSSAQPPNQPHKRRRRGRRGRRRKTVSMRVQEVQIHPQTFRTSPEQSERLSEDGSEKPGSVDGEGHALNGTVRRKLSEKAPDSRSSKVKAFNLTYMKHELDAMLNTLTYINSLRELKSDVVNYQAELSKGSEHFEETLRSLLESVKKAESAQWSNLESNAAAKGRRPR